MVKQVDQQICLSKTKGINDVEVDISQMTLFQTKTEITH